MMTSGKHSDQKLQSSPSSFSSITVPAASPPPTSPSSRPPKPNSDIELAAAFAAAVAMVVGLYVLLTWTIGPKNPTFHLQDATLQAFNFTDSNRLLTTSIQVNISSRNPNRLHDIDYYSMGAYALYRGQNITLPVELCGGFLGSKQVGEWSEILSGERMQLSPDMAQLMAEDLKYSRVVPVDFKVYGWLRWEIGNSISRMYNFEVDCPAFLLPAGGGGNSTVKGGDHDCNVWVSFWG
ncbi:NDR1/HIN1-like protein 1 [Linum perenne]